MLGLIKWLTLAVEVFLVLGLVSDSMGQTSQSTLVPSYGIIRSANTVEKIVTWADGTSETITVDDKGKIFLNGNQKIAFGFHIITAMMVGEPEDSQRANKILDQLQGWGVRFMTVGCMNWDTLDWIRFWLGFWLPKLYSHKMFVMLQYQQIPDVSLDVDAQYNRFSSIIDMITEQKYADIVFSVLYSWEQDDFGHTNAEVEAYLSNLYPKVKSKLRRSIIGDVPVIAKHCATISDTGTVQIVKWSDVPNWDMYPSGDWMTWIDPRLQTYHDHTLPLAGKEGYQIWLQESGHSGGCEYYTPELFQYLLDGGGYKDVSLIFLWCLEWYYADYPNAWFDMEGNPHPRLLELVLYIP